ncbi:PRD domain-containing protein [Clostridium sp. YIM B02500]|nr:PRD domain-containing protein [Clostridium sp. YIM B02500]
MQIRYCISEYIFSSNKSNCIDDNEFYKNIFNGIDLRTLKEIVLKVISKYSIRPTDAAFENILTHIAITIKRSSNKNLIVYNIDQINVIEKTSELPVVKEIVKEIYEKLNIYLIETEIYYITQHLIASKKYLNIIENEDIDECDYIVLLIINRVKEITEIDFSDDGQLITGLKIYLKIAISKMKFDMNIRNDMFEVIKNDCPLTLINQFMPIQYNKIRNGLLRNDPEELIKDWVVNCIDEYIYASTPSEVSKQVI